MPDLNSLPPSSHATSNNTSSTSNNGTMSSSSNSNSDGPLQPINVSAAQAQRGETGSPSPRASVSLQAAATVNAGLQHEPSRRSSNSSTIIRNRSSPTSSRRRSQVLMNIQLNDPTVPAPGELQDSQNSTQRNSDSAPLSHSPLLMAHSPLLPARDPHHNRTPSLGELHQELEAEQEAQVNRLLGMIRQQQLQLQALQAQRPQDPSSFTEQAIAESDRSAPTSAHPTPPATITPNPTLSHSHSTSTGQSPHPRSPSYPRSSFDLARADITSRRSRTPSRGASPRLRSTSISDSAGGGEQYVLSGRDEGAFYQAETQMLTRENQMLRHRIRDLERQLQEMGPSSPTVPHVPHEPSLHSHLTHSTSASEEEGRRGLPTVADSGKEE